MAPNDRYLPSPVTVESIVSPSDCSGSWFETGQLEGHRPEGAEGHWPSERMDLQVSRRVVYGQVVQSTNNENYIKNIRSPIHQCCPRLAKVHEIAVIVLAQ